jgi:excisionase family DNA binding protein
MDTCILAKMADEITTPKAAVVLGTSPETIRALIADGTLTGRRSQRGWWLIDRRSLELFLEMHGPLNGGRRRRGSNVVVTEGSAGGGDESKRLGELADAEPADAPSAIRERDALRARVVVLEDSSAGMRDAADLQRQADAERSEVVKQLLAAVASSERADALRGQALEKLEDALARATVPGSLPDG